jgi:hypothetical protein
LKYLLINHEGISLDIFIKKNKKWITETVHHWTGETKVSVQEILDRISKRSNELKLSLPNDEKHFSIEFISFLSSIFSNFRYTGKYKPRDLNRSHNNK